MLYLLSIYMYIRIMLEILPVESYYSLFIQLYSCSRIRKVDSA
eukprot:COSAG05_NODE_2539_length_2929_cov_14.539223_3_plen_43_part_00